MIDPAWIMPSFYVGGLLFLGGGQFVLHKNNTSKIDALTAQVSVLANAVTAMTAKDPALQQRVSDQQHEIDRIRDRVHDLAGSMNTISAKAETRGLTMERELAELRSFLLKRGED